MDAIYSISLLHIHWFHVYCTLQLIIVETQNIYKQYLQTNPYKLQMYLNRYDSIRMSMLISMLMWNIEGCCGPCKDARNCLILIKSCTLFISVDQQTQNRNKSTKKGAKPIHKNDSMEWKLQKDISAADFCSFLYQKRETLH